MTILTRYILKAHVAPFFFGLSVLTAIIFINAVSKRIENELAGKGLSLDVIVEVLALSLPHVVALTLPMAVLVAVLYAFSSLAAENEIAALKGSGVNLMLLLAPPLAAATLLCAGMIAFNDTILPDTNHRLAGLIQDINRKSPTLSLREQVLNEIRAGDFGASTYYLKAGRIEPGTNRLWDVAIYDLSEPNRRRTIYADSGKMAFNQELTDLFLALDDGVMYESDRVDPQRFQRADFRKQLVRIAGVGNQFERQEDREFKSDREMDFDELADVVAVARVEYEQTQRQFRDMAHASLQAALRGEAELTSGRGRMSPPVRRRVPDDEGSVPAGSPADVRDDGAPGESVRTDRRDALQEVLEVPGALPPSEASETGPSRRAAGRAGRLALARAAEGPQQETPTRQDTRGRQDARTAQQPPTRQDAQTSSQSPTRQDARTSPQSSTGRSLERGRMVRPTPENDPVVRETSSRLLQWASLADTHQARVRQYEVEFWKKFAIPAACIIFVLIGAPIGIRFPRGGVGMVIMVSLAVFAVYYAGLIGGESLADEGLLTPFWAMWGANLVFLVIGLWAVSRIGMESATSRGGGWEDLFHVLKRTAGWPLRRLRLAGKSS